MSPRGAWTSAHERRSTPSSAASRLTGNAVVVVSSEIQEVLGLADTVLVISDGRVLQTLPASQIDQHGVLDLVMKGTAA